MQLKQLLDDDRAVSPVIGVILMVAITVILAAVIGTFVLGLGDSVNQTATAGVTFDQGNSGNVTITVTSMGSNTKEVQYKVVDNSGDGGEQTSFTTVGSGTVGSSATTSTLESSDRVIVKAIGSGDTKDAVVATYEVE